ncbi:MAG: gliding motility-associated C-terminal domain-containing protein [Flavobacteriales bacterium]
MRNLFQSTAIAFLMILSVPVIATHNRAGEITYRRIAGEQFKYEITITTYTKTGGASDDADRCFLELNFGDNSPTEDVYRVNGPSSGDCNHDGEYLGGNIKKNVYITTHTFPGVGTYTVSMQDQNRNGGVKNIPSSDNVWFYIESEIVIDPNSGGNEAPTLQNPPIDNGCINQPFLHNPGAVDPDGDSLVYSIVACKTMDGAAIPGFKFLDEVAPGSSMTIDPRSGTLTWDSPIDQGEYNVAIRIEEWRYNENSGDLVFVGSTLRDMQVNILVCEDKNPPQIAGLKKTCVQAGDQLRLLAVATDRDDDNLEFTATGYPINPDKTGYMLPNDTIRGKQPLQMEFVWNTECRHVQFESYWVYFKAKEDIFNSQEELVDFEELEIQVIAPPVTITEVAPSGASLKLNWTPAPCSGADGYDIYRFSDSTGYVGANCNTGVPEALGYVKVGRTDGINSTFFQDDDNGKGLVHGQRYCYMIVATYPDRSESYASLEACGELIRDVPILNRASVSVTDVSTGADSIAWYPPIELKTDVFLPPYQYKLSRAESENGSYEVIYEGPTASDFLDLDTVFTDTDLNTENKQYYYKIEMLAGTERATVGTSKKGATIYLTSKPSDNTLTLEWSVDVPWINDEYTLYRFVEDTVNDFVKIATTTNTTYKDTGLVNLREYRYFVKSVGKYSSQSLPEVLVNYSQIHTGIPEDKEAPCVPPGQIIDGDCNLDEVYISWRNPNNLCKEVDDVLSYNVYYTPRLGQTMEVIQVNDDPMDTTFAQANSESIAGCYAITAVDSFGNESELSESLCIDNCPIYELPNVFTPGNDGRNDFFQPFPYKFIESIHIEIFNRWGLKVFETENPDILWDGTDQKSGNPASDGTYYYVCRVREIRLTGVEERELLGYFTLLREQKSELAK